MIVILARAHTEFTHSLAHTHTHKPNCDKTATDVAVDDVQQTPCCCCCCCGYCYRHTAATATTTTVIAIDAHIYPI